MSRACLASPHAAGKGEDKDIIFNILRKTNEAIACYGNKVVVNGSAGVIYDDDGKFVTLSSIEEHYRKLSAEELMNYAPIEGLPEFLDAAIEYTFQGNQPSGTYTKAIATPGGSGALRHVFHNYLGEGEKVLVPDWYWGPYATIAAENHRGIACYQLFDENLQFNIPSLIEKTRELLKVQDNVVTVFNTPAHNPTGYSLSDNDWQKLIEFYKECAENKKKKLILLLDIAYIDYAGSAQQTRKFMAQFGNLPENLLVLFAFSMSKSFLVYGMRSGALIGLSSSEEVAMEFYNLNSHSNRGTWSNGSRGAQRLLADMMKNKELLQSVEKERSQYYDLIVKRANIFVNEAREAGLRILPYNAGFFITVPAADPQRVTDNLAASNIFAVPLKNGVRIAICAIPTFQVPGLAIKVKEALDT